MRIAANVFAAAAVLALPGLAFSQTYDVQSFNPGPAQSRSVFDLTQARILGNLQWEATILGHYQDSPLIYVNPTGDEFDVVGSQLTLNVMGALGIADRLQLGVDVPLVLLQDGEAFASPTVPDAPDAGFGIGDVRVVPTVLIFDQNTDDSPGGPALSLALNVWLPTADHTAYQGDSSLRVEPRLLYDWALPSQVIISANVGWLIREEQVIGDREIDDALTWGVGVDAPVAADGQLHVLAELVGNSIALGELSMADETGLEANLGVRFHAKNGLLLQGGGGAGLVRTMGTPAWRAFLGLGFARGSDCDPDGDGLGCDGTVDACPNDAEDFDGFRDEDGCPDPDNDDDGVPDRRDACPDSPEDIDGFEDEDGCPDPDNDGDGVPDINDECPLEPEDMDGFEQADGCPDPDNDGDGILDVDDACPDIAEDMDGFEDEDGCVDFDNDRDGILDGDDQCPLEPEDFDGFEDEDGCPEEGAGMVTLTCERIEISETVHFDTNEATIREESHELLDQIAAVLRGASYIRRVRIEGHTDSRGDDDFNMDLSSRRAAAVVTYLAQRGGIDISRMISVGLGETRPVGDNSTRPGRQANRRVEFHVVEQDSNCGQMMIPDSGAR